MTPDGDDILDELFRTPPGARGFSSEHYKLEGRNVVPAASFLDWGMWFEMADRRVKQEYLGRVFVSTVFLSIDHSFTSRGAPLLFETMIFGGPLDGRLWRCSTWEQAEAQHARAARAARRTLPFADWLIYRWANGAIPLYGRLYARAVRHAQAVINYDSGLRAYADDYRAYRTDLTGRIAEARAREVFGRFMAGGDL